MGKRTNTAKWDDKHKRWRIDVQLDGVRRSFYSSTPGRTGQREANSKADAWLDDGVQNTKVKVISLYEGFLKGKQASTSRSNWRSIESRWRIHIKPYLGQKKIDRVTENDLQGIINRAYSEHNLSAKTLRSLRADLVAFCKYCRIERVSTLFPESLIIPAGAKRSQKSIMQPQDLIKLFNIDTTIVRGKKVPEEYIHAYRLEVLTGLRPGELRGLQWADIVGNEIHLKRAINIYGEVTQGKNENAIRAIHLSELALSEIEAQRSLTGNQKFVFEISCYNTYRAHWQRYIESNELVYRTPYELRHTFVSIAKQLPEGLVKNLVGHSKSMDTFGVYGHEIEGEAESTAKMVNGLFLNILKDQA